MEEFTIIWIISFVISQFSHDIYANTEQLLITTIESFYNNVKGLPVKLFESNVQKN